LGQREQINKYEQKTKGRKDEGAHMTWKWHRVPFELDKMDHYFQGNVIRKLWGISN